MSFWTHIRGTVEVSVPGRTQPEIEYILNTVLEHLPLVTGSEGDMHVHAVRHSGHDCSSSHDEFGRRTDHATDWFGSRTRRRGVFSTQSSYLLVIEASLRDRLFSRTKIEFMKWLCRLAKRVYVEDVLVRISGDDNPRGMLINRLNGLYDLCEPPSWSCSRKAAGEPCWWEYLVWESSPVSDLPLAHEAKYFGDPRITEELERRRKWAESFE